MVIKMSNGILDGLLTQSQHQQALRQFIHGREPSVRAAVIDGFWGIGKSAILEQVIRTSDRIRLLCFVKDDTTYTTPELDKAKNIVRILNHKLEMPPSNSNDQELNPGQLQAFWEENLDRILKNINGNSTAKYSWLKKAFYGRRRSGQRIMVIHYITDDSENGKRLFSTLNNMPCSSSLRLIFETHYYEAVRNLTRGYDVKRINIKRLSSREDNAGQDEVMDIISHLMQSDNTFQRLSDTERESVVDVAKLLAGQNPLLLSIACERIRDTLQQHHSNIAPDHLCKNICSTMDAIEAQKSWDPIMPFSKIFDDHNSLARLRLSLSNEHNANDYADNLDYRYLDDAGLLVHRSGGQKKLAYFLVHLLQKKSPGGTSVQSDNSPVMEIAIRLQDTGNGLVEVIESPSGQGENETELPFANDQLPTVLKALTRLNSLKIYFDDQQKEELTQLGLWKDEALLATDKLLEKVGQKCFDSLLPSGQVRELFVGARNSNPNSNSITLRLRLNPKDVDIARQPWELLYQDPAHLVKCRSVKLVRYITFDSPPTSLGITGILHVLYVRCSPSDIKEGELGQVEWQQVSNALTQMNEIEVSEPVRTFTQVTHCLQNQPVHVIHFDGHGRFGRVCQCGIFNNPHLQECHECKAKLNDIALQGWLAFEKDDGTKDWISSKRLAEICANRKVRLVVLSSCSTGTVRGETIFGGVAPALIGAGIPAVVAMQLPITADSAAQFFGQGFYKRLAAFDCLPDAVSAGRDLIVNHEWFIPVLYLRDKDKTGCLFKKEENHG